jgi:hypothetical protein
MGLMQPRRHRMRKQARRDSALDWIRSGARVTVQSYAKRYGVDRYTAYDDLTAMNFPLLAAAARWAQRPPAMPRPSRRHTTEFDDERVGDPDWVWVGDQWMFVVGYTRGGAPFGCYADELEDSPGDGVAPSLVFPFVSPAPARYERGN